MRVCVLYGCGLYIVFFYYVYVMYCVLYEIVRRVFVWFVYCDLGFVLYMELVMAVCMRLCVCAC